MKKLCKYAVLCMDPGFNLGTALVSIDKKPVVVDIDCYSTKPSKVKSVRKADDDYRRADEAWEHAMKISKQAEVIVAVFVETTSAGQGSRSVFSMGYNKQLCECVARCQGAPIFHLSAQAVKKAATGRVNASKQQVIDAMRERLAYLPWDSFNKGQLEHMADACAMFLAGWRLPELKAIMRMIK